MAVITPLYPLGAFGPGASLLVAIVIGVAFGFVLERAGLGDARKLTGQFYLRDMTVLKVMFTAIVTAMLGAEALSAAGLLEIRFILVPPTYLIPQLLGGVIFGVGFVTGGYCPGTSCVAASSGRLDGAVVFAGMLSGILLFAELYPRFDPLYGEGPFSYATLSDLTGLPRMVMVIGVALLGVITLVLIERWEGRKPLAVDRARQPEDAMSGAT